MDHCNSRVVVDSAAVAAVVADLDNSRNLERVADSIDVEDQDTKKVEEHDCTNLDFRTALEEGVLMHSVAVAFSEGNKIQVRKRVEVR